MSRRSRRLAVSTVLILTACEAEPPTLSGVQPQAGPPGTELTVQGDHLTPETTVTVGDAALSNPVFVDAHTIRGAVPDTLGAGPVDLVVRDGSGREMRRTKAFTVESLAPAENPCRATTTRFTAIPPDGSEVKIDVHLPGGEVQRTRFPTSDIQAIEVRAIPMDGSTDDPAVCSAIYLVLQADQRRVLFDADDTLNLKKQAQMIAQGLGKRLKAAEGLPQ